eukprot:gene6095-10102_t
MSHIKFWSNLTGKQICDTNLDGTKKHTKIVCTIGPKTQSVEQLEGLMKAGMNVVRMNFSHGEHEYHLKTIQNARKAADNLEKTIGILLDTKGPEIRTGYFKNDIKEVTLEKDSEFTFTTKDEEFETGDEKHVFIDYKNIVKVLKKDDIVLVDDGLISCKVLETTETEVKVLVQNTGKLGTKKGCNLPGTKVDLPALTDKDVADLQFGVKNGVDFIAASFTRKASDVRDIRKVLGPKGSNIKIISKIENLEGLENFDEILEESDGIMVARGDLGVEIPLERVVLAQKMMIAKCNLAGKPVITATQMLETMIVNPRPTRAEATDVANAVYDGSDCVMLSGETAKGDYPIEAVKRMSQICVTTEDSMDYSTLYSAMRTAIKEQNEQVSIAETIASSAVKTAEELKASMIITLTESGFTARLISKYKTKTPLLVITQHKQTARQLQITRGIKCRVVDSILGTDNIVKSVIRDLEKSQILNPGDVVVVVFGNVEGVTGQINNMKVMRLQ